MNKFRLLIAVTIVSIAGLCAEPPASSKTGKDTLEPGSTRVTDENGKRWILKKTPFGVAKIAEVDETSDRALRAKETSIGIRAFDAGDSVRFERMTPFGKSTWTKKKAELDDSEQAAWTASQKSKSAPGSLNKQAK
jgi:hypothetical protein